MNSISTSLLVTAAVLAAAQTAPSPEFDVAAIKPNKSNTTRSGTRENRGSWTATNINVKSLITQAYDILPEQLVGAPAWVESDNFDIDAKGEPAESLSGAEQGSLTRRRLQALLASRFAFKAHRETREWQVYALVAGKKGPRLTSAEKREGSSTNTNNGHMEAKNITMDSFARRLSNLLGRPTVNETGIAGQFDLTLDFEPEQRTARPSSSDSPIAGVDAPRPSLVTAIQDQLGLKLESRKAPVEMLVVDQVARPSEN